MADASRLRVRTGMAMLLLCRARLLITLVPLRFWRAGLGLAGDSATVAAGAGQEARRLAIHVERAAARLPFACNCLPRAMALSALLRHAGIAHALVFAVRPQAFRHTGDRLHAWVERGGVRLIGDLPGPWVETLRLGQSADTSAA